MQALIVEPMKPPYVKEIGEELEDLQHEVGGYIEAIYPFEDEVAIICNEEGKLDGLELNRALRTDQGEIYDIIAGTFMIVGLNEENFGSLTPEQITKYTELYKVPEVFLMRDGKITAISIAPTIYEPVQKSEYEEVRNGIRLVVRRDEDPIDPRRMGENLGRLVCFDKYLQGDNHGFRDKDEFLKALLIDHFGDEEKAEASKKADEKVNEIYEKLDSGTSFAEVAKDYSEDVATKDNGGRIGTFNKGEMTEKFNSEFEDIEISVKTKKI